MKKIGIIGAGNMGSGIAQKIAQEGLDVVLVDTEEDFVQRGLENIKNTLDEAIQRKILTPEQAEEVQSRISGTTDLESVKDADIVIEVIFEDLEVKTELFKKLDSLCDEKTILASNTSSLSIAELADSVNRKDRFIGLHFFYHPAKNRLVEIIPIDTTSEEALNIAGTFSKVIGKTAIDVADYPGFAVNRFFVPWLNEATRLLGEGVADIPTIDQTAKKVFDIGMGPFELMNATGIPIAYHSTMSLERELGDFYAPSSCLKDQFESGEIWNLEGEASSVEAKEVEERLLGVVFAVACYLVEEGVATMEDTDRGAMIGLRWGHGPFEMMNIHGIKDSEAIVIKFVEMNPGLSMPDNLDQQAASDENWKFSIVDLKVKDGMARIIFNRPEAMNAINEELMRQLDIQITKANADPEVKAIVLEGAGKAFMAGADINYFIEKIDAGRVDDIVEFTKYGHSVLRKIDESEKLVIAKLDGLALGGGLEIALTADTIVATPKATMAFPETGIGIYPGLGGTQRTPRYLGKEMAKYLILTGKMLDGETAYSIGLVEYLASPRGIDRTIQAIVGSGVALTKATKGQPSVPEGFQEIIKLMEDSNIASMLSGPEGKDGLAAKISKTISFKAPIAIELANRLIDEGIQTDLETGLKMELDNLTEIFPTKDAYEGLSSVVQRRRPTFTGE